MKSQPRVAEAVFAILRIAAGLLFARHAYRELFGAPAWTHMRPALASAPGLAACLGLLAGIAVAAGFKTRPSAGVGALLAGWTALRLLTRSGLGLTFAPAMGFEAAVLFALVFLLVALQGPGPWALDGRA